MAKPGTQYQPISKSTTSFSGEGDARLLEHDNCGELRLDEKGETRLLEGSIEPLTAYSEPAKPSTGYQSA